MPFEELVDADKCTLLTSNRPLVLEFKLSRAGSGGRVLVNFFEAIFALALSDVFTGRQDTITKYSTSRREMELLSSGSGSSFSLGGELLLKMSTLIPGSVFFFPGEEAVVGLTVVVAGAGSASPSFTGETIFPSRELLRFAVRGDAGDKEALTDEPREALPTLVKSGLMFSLSAVAALFFLAVDDDEPDDIADDVDLMFMDSCCIDKLTSDVPLRSELLLFIPNPTEDLTPCNVRADLRAHSNSSRWLKTKDESFNSINSDLSWAIDSLEGSAMITIMIMICNMFVNQIDVIWMQAWIFEVGIWLELHNNLGGAV